MNLIDFISQYPDEASCKQKFKQYRDQVGGTCANCQGRDHYWKQDKEQYECKQCKTCTTLKSGTVMHKSSFPTVLVHYRASANFYEKEFFSQRNPASIGS